jgi:hypothetical protein
VSPASAYARVSRFAQHGDVTVDRALDPVTGLPVLVYRFPGAPVAGLEALDPEEVWHALEAGLDDAGAFLVTNVVDGAVSLAARPSALDDFTLERAFAALATATAAGIGHGDLEAHRVYRRGAHVWIEGYGVPWSDATPVDDARQLARSLLALAGHGLSAQAKSALAGAAEDGDTATLLASLRRPAAPVARPAAPTVAPLAAAVAEPPADVPPPEVEPVIPVSIPIVPAPSPARAERNAASEGFHEVRLAPRDAPADRTEAVVEIGRGAADAPAFAGEGDERGDGSPPATPVLATTPDAPAPRPRFSKAPPPDVRYRSGGDRPVATATPPRPLGSTEAGRDRRRVWLLGLLVVGAVLLALLTVFGRRPPAPPIVGANGVATYVVDVRVTPERLPPVSLVVVASPPGSQHAAGTVIRTVPDRVVLDAAGTWRLQGRFDGRASAVVSVVVPGEASIVLPFPENP